MASADHPAARAWAKLCHHCDGIAIATTVEALAQAGFFAALSFGPQPAGRLADLCGMRDGLFAVAYKLLHSQGFVWARNGSVGLSPAGEAWAQSVTRYRGAAERIGTATALLRALLHGKPAPALPPLGVAEGRVWHQIHGALIAAAAFGLNQTGTLPSLAAGSRTLLGAELAAARVLAAVGWITLDGAEASLTEEGRVAAGMVAQYSQPISYFATFAAVGTLLRNGIPDSSSEQEWHIERGLDIAFSGTVVRQAAGDPAIACMLPLFDKPDLADQPQALVDTGSGDGTLLAVLYGAVKERTRRGAALAEAPLHLVGVEVNEVSRRATAACLAGVDAPSLALIGDIGAPDAIAASLAAAGLDCRAALHVNKSVIHNRCYRPARNRRPAPAISAVFSDRSGAAIAADDVYSGLVELFEAWRPWTQRFGMLTIEAHTVDPDLAARHIGRSLITCLDAEHGYSGQLLMEISPHRAASAAAGYRVRASHDLGQGMVGVPIMSVDHIMPA